MKLHLIIVPLDGAPFPSGSPANIEIRDTALEDAPAVLLQRTHVVVPSGRVTELPITLELTAVPDGTTVWVHIDADRDGRLSVGDYVTVESYPVRDVREQSLVIQVKRVT